MGGDLQGFGEGQRAAGIEPREGRKEGGKKAIAVFPFLVDCRKKRASK